MCLSLITCYVIGATRSCKRVFSTDNQTTVRDTLAGTQFVYVLHTYHTESARHLQV